jgi:transposase-like protein
MEKIEKTVVGKKQRQTLKYTAQEKCQAVLSIWTERRKPVEVCRELTIPWALLSHWQTRAMEGMLQALQPRIKLDQGPALSPRLQTMLAKRRFGPGFQSRLSMRLARLQETTRGKTENQEQKAETKL